jgi:hypothetical protein
MKLKHLICFVVLSSHIAFGQDEHVEELFKEIQIFPNPTSEILFLRNGDKVESYSIINMQGQKVQEGMQHAQVISLIDLPIGIYFLELKIGEMIERRRIEKR